MFNDTDSELFEISMTDFTWYYYYKCRSDNSLGWNGFMEEYHIQSIYQTSIIVIPLPFVNHPASNYNTILTVLFG